MRRWSRTAATPPSPQAAMDTMVMRTNLQTRRVTANEPDFIQIFLSLPPLSVPGSTGVPRDTSWSQCLRVLLAASFSDPPVGRPDNSREEGSGTGQPPLGPSSSLLERLGCGQGEKAPLWGTHPGKSSLRCQPGPGAKGPSGCPCVVIPHVVLARGSHQAQPTVQGGYLPQGSSPTF